MNVKTMMVGDDSGVLTVRTAPPVFPLAGEKSVPGTAASTFIAGMSRGRLTAQVGTNQANAAHRGGQTYRRSAELLLS